MNVSIGEYFEKFIQRVVAEGRYGSASDVVRNGLRLMEKEEAKLQALRETINHSLADDRRYSWEEVELQLNETSKGLEKEGF